MLSDMNPVQRTAVLCCLLLVAAGCASGRPAAEQADPTPVAQHATSADRGPSDGRWWRVLRRLDRKREQAFTGGDVRLLRRVYTPGSQPLRRDARVLREYRRRGLRLDSARLRLTSVEPVHRTTRRVVLRVVDTLAPVRVRTEDGGWQTLPRDRPSEHTIALRRVGTGWRIAGIRPATS